MKAIVHSPDGDTDFFHIVGILQGDTLAPYLFIICLGYINKSNKRKWVNTKKKKKSSRYLAETISDADANTPVQDECQLHSLEQAVGGIGLYMNANKTILLISNKKEPSPL